MSSLTLRLIGRYLARRKGRSLITLLGIALGVTMVMATALTNRAILSRYQEMVEGVAGRADLQVSAVSGQGFPAGLLAEVEATPGVAVAAPVVASASPVEAGERKSVATFYGIDPDRERLVREYRLLAGRLPAAGREVAITDELAAALAAGPGDRLQLLSTRGLEEFTVTGTFDARSTARGSLGPFGVLPLAEAQALFGREGRLDIIDIRVAEGAGAAAVEQDLAARLAGLARVGTPAERSRDMQRLLDSLIFSLTMAGSISLFAGSFIIYTNVAIGVAERRRDLSILRALGMRRAEVLNLVLVEAAGLGLVGAALGLAWGYGLAGAVAQGFAGQILVSYGIESAPVRLIPADLALALAVAVGTSLVAAFGPARSTVRVSPMEAMRPAEVSLNGGERQPPARLAAGVVLALAGPAFIAGTWPEQGMIPAPLLRAWALALLAALRGVVLLLPALLPVANRFLLRPLLASLLGVPGRIAADNLVRQPRRTAATVSALMISLTFMVGMGGYGVANRAAFNRWFDQVIGWDLNVSTSFVGISAQVEMDPSLVRALADIPGVRLVSPQKMGQIILSDNAPAFLQAFDHRLLRQYSELPLEEGAWDQALAAMEQGGAVIISPAVARRLEVGLGDLLPLPTPQGEQSFRVVGIMADITPSAAPSRWTGRTT